MKKLIAIALLLSCSVAMMEASSPLNQIVAVNDHEVFTQHQQVLVTPVVELKAFELPVIPYLTGESAVGYTAINATFNDMRAYYLELEKSTYAPVKVLPKTTVTIISKTFSESLPPNLSGKNKRITYRYSYVDLSPENLS